MLVSLTKKTGFIVTGDTNCSCCHYLNFSTGIFDTREEADAEVTRHREAKTCASQYSKTGVYAVRAVEYEVLEDGECSRIILGAHVLDGLKFHETGDDQIVIGTKVS